MEEEITLKDLHHAHYLTGWKLFVWRIFVNKVFPDWLKGHYSHIKLIKDGSVIHANEDDECCCYRK